jgi:hypothetical protein
MALLENAQTWSKDNPKLAIGGGAVAGLVALLGILRLLLPALKNRSSDVKGGRSGRGKSRARNERRALEESARPEFAEELDEEELEELLSALFENLE